MKILVILPRFPYPLEKGDKLRAYHQIRVLSQNNDVYLFALSHNKVNKEYLVEMQRYCKEIEVARLSRIACTWRVLRNMLSVRSLQIGWWDSRKARSQCLRFVESVNPDVVYAQMIRTIKYAAHIDKPKVMDFQDALSMNFERRMMSYRGLRYFALHYEFKMLRSAEYNATSIFDGLTIISELDCEAIPQHRSTHIDIVRNGVDFEYFHPIDINKDYDIVFCGNMQYRPNIDAARYLAGQIMPIVWRTHPQARVLLAGATPVQAVRQLSSSNVTVTGTVPDIRPCYARSKVFVAPMRVGSGLQNKLLEAMSMGIPCVATSIVNCSLGAAEDKEILLGNDATQLASAIVHLLDDESLRRSLSENAARFVHSNFSWESTGLQLEEILRNAIENKNQSVRRDLVAPFNATPNAKVKVK